VLCDKVADLIDTACAIARLDDGGSITAVGAVAVRSPATGGDGVSDASDGTG